MKREGRSGVKSSEGYYGRAATNYIRRSSVEELCTPSEGKLAVEKKRKRNPIINPMAWVWNKKCSKTNVLFPTILG